MERQSPTLVVSKEEDVVSHGYVMYGLLKPGKDGKGVESAAAMVNVIPRKRIYRMETIEELETFRSELLKRPLVIQPIVLAGSGIQKLNCFFKVNKENWVVMLNQNHPKVMGRIMIGIDSAKTLLRRGQPFILEFMFSDIIRRLYYSSMAHTTAGRFQYIDCQHGDLIIRASGDSFHQGMAWEVKAQHMQFHFEDVTDSDVMMRTMKEAAYERQSPLIQVIADSELRRILSGWTFEQVEEEEEVEEEEDGEEETAFVEGAVGPSIMASEPAPQRGRIRGRANRASPSGHYEVSVELHAASDDVQPSEGTHKHVTQHVSGGYATGDHSTAAQVVRGYATNEHHYTDLATTRTEHAYKDLRSRPHGYNEVRLSPHAHEVTSRPPAAMNHHHQGSGRSGSSATDSGYEGEDMGGFEDRKHGRLLQVKDNNRNHVPNGRYDFDNPAYVASDNYRMVEQSVDRHKAMAARLLQNHTRGPSDPRYHRGGQTDPRHQEMYSPSNNMPTISQSIDSQEGYSGESVI